MEWKSWSHEAQRPHKPPPSRGHLSRDTHFTRKRRHAVQKRPERQRGAVTLKQIGKKAPHSMRTHAFLHEDPGVCFYLEPRQQMALPCVVRLVEILPLSPLHPWKRTSLALLCRLTWPPDRTRPHIHTRPDRGNRSRSDQARLGWMSGLRLGLA